MRLIGHLASEDQARTLSDYLLVKGIQNGIEPEKGVGWALWVHDEDQLDEATAVLAAYQQCPDDPQYATKAREASAIRAREQKGEAEYRKKVRDRTNLFPSLMSYGLGPVTLILMLVSVGVFLLSKFGTDVSSVAWAPITVHLRSGLYEIRHGEVWRLITPIFLHFGPLHILFNMFWLRDLGSMIEARQGPWMLVLLTVVIAAGSNFGQYLVSGPAFGGMSGVVYGLIGYIWMRGKFDPGSGLFLHPSTVATALVWFVLCYTNVLGNVANTTHAVGLVMGVVWGYASSLRYQ